MLKHSAHHLQGFKSGWDDVEPFLVDHPLKHGERTPEMADATCSSVSLLGVLDLLSMSRAASTRSFSIASGS